jgi:hypothetical protein
MIINKLPLKFGNYLESEYKLQTKQFGETGNLLKLAQQLIY